ncbi:FecR family protein [Lunatimonas salinarum]|uniref:FecR family protein n=1 Tax=Lunatimonas salinarum TaxID=1774590 RepID=UPI001AE0BA84|nr:FecR family protein [Lunatimonas salinarum]
MDKKRFFNLLEKQAKGLSSPEENRLISDVFDELQRLPMSWEMNEREEDAIKSRIKRQVATRLKDRAITKSNRYSYRVLAAFFVLLIGLGFVIYQRNVSVQPVPMAERMTGERQKAVITLGDGSVVYLNVNSKIRFPEEFASDSREIELEGEAFFEVVPDSKRPFLVQSSGIKTRVLGTSFNVKAISKSQVEVMVKTGRVGVIQGGINEERQLVLSPNQLALVDPENRKMAVSEVDAADYLAWRSEQIAFDMTPFSEVLAKLEKVYNIAIDVEGMAGEGCFIKASYENRSLYTVLYGLKNLVDFQYEKTVDGRLRIRYRGCKN